MRSFRVVQAKRWLLTISLFLMAVEVTSQPIRFSTFYDSNNGAGLLEAVVLLDDGKLMAAGSNLNGSYSDGHHVVVDVDGNLLLEHEVTFSEMTYNTPAGLSVPDALVEEFRRVSSMEEYTHSL